MSESESADAEAGRLKIHGLAPMMFSCMNVTTVIVYSAAGLSALGILVASLVYHARSTRRTAELAKIRERERDELDETLRRAIDTKAWGMIVQAACVEQGYNAERQFAGSSTAPFGLMMISMQLLFTALALMLPELRFWLPITSLVVFAGVAAITHAHMKMMEQAAATQRRRTKFQAEFLSMIVNGAAKMKPDDGSDVQAF